MRRPRPGTLQTAVRRSVAAADWIEDTDAGTVRLAEDLAAVLDEAWRGSLLGAVAVDVEVAAKLGHLLRELGLTPAARYRLGLWDVRTDDPLAEVFRIADSSPGDAAV